MGKAWKPEKEKKNSIKPINKLTTKWWQRKEKSKKDRQAENGIKNRERKKWENYYYALCHDYSRKASSFNRIDIFSN